MEIIELKIDDFDPVEFVRGLDAEGVAFLHSGKNTDGERWSIIAWDPVKTVSDFDELKEECSRRRTTNPFSLPFCGGAIGYFSYDLGYDLFGIPQTARDDLEMPHIHMNFYDKFLCFDNKEKKTYGPVGLKYEFEKKPSSDLPKLDFQPEFSESEYNTAFAKIKQYILDGHIYQVNLTHRLTADFESDYRDLFGKINDANPAPFSAYLEGPDFHILSASPERFLRLKSGRIMTCPVKGTRPRGATPEEDEALKRELIESEKEEAELNMITDLLRNDIGQVSEIGTVEVKKHRALQKCPTVWHTYSSIEGLLREDLHATDLMRACMPGGSITGCPKKRAMEIIDEIEPVCRGPYTGSVCYMSDCGNMDSSIVIRTLIAKSGKLHLNVGGGIVADSDCRAEYRETLDKAKSFLYL